MADPSSRTLQVPEREVNKAEEARMEAIQREQQQQQQARKLTKREFCLLVVIVVLTVVICGLVGFIIGWFVWPHSSPDSNPISENDGIYRDRPVDIDDVRIVNNSTDADSASVERLNNETICLTKGCLRAGLQLLEKIDQTADPCRDFRSFSCGGSETRNAILPTKGHKDSEGVLGNLVNANVLKFLQSDVGRIGKRSSERKVKQLFAACMDTEAIQRKSKRAFLDAIGKLGGWPAVGLWSREKVRDWKLSEPLEQLQLNFDTDALFSWKLIPDLDNPEKYIITLKEGGLTLPDRKFYLGNYTSPVLKAYRNFLKTAVVRLGATGKPVARFVQDVFNFEKKLAKISPIVSASADWPVYNKTTVRSLIAMSPELDWRSFFRSFPNMTSSSEVLLANPEYFTNLSRLVSTSYPRIFQNYLAWRLLYKVMPFMSRDLRDAYMEMSMVVTGGTMVRDRRDDCLEFVNRYMGSAIGALYSKSPKQRENKKFVRHMAEIIKEAFVKAVDNISWMDVNTKLEALEKATSLGLEVGFPNYMKITAVVDNLYSDFYVQSNQTFFQSLTNVIRASVNKRLEKAWEPVDKTMLSWEDVNVQTVKASYNHRTNVIVLPGGLLQAPMFERSFPDAVNFGTLGTILAREMAASLVETGTNFDGSGKLKPWWTNDTTASYHTELECLLERLDSSSSSLFHAGALLELLEDIGTLAGLRLSYKAWATTNNNENKIPGANLTPQQGFFVAFAQRQCENSQSSNLFKALKQPLVFGLTEFSEAFRCLPEPTSNTGEDCSIL